MAFAAELSVRPTFDGGHVGDRSKLCQRLLLPIGVCIALPFCSNVHEGYIRSSIEAQAASGEYRDVLALLDSCRNVSDHFVDAVTKRDLEGAYSLFAPSIKSTFSLPTFLSSAQVMNDQYGRLIGVTYRNQTVEWPKGNRLLEAAETKTWYATETSMGPSPSRFAVVLGMSDGKECSVRSYQILNYGTKVPPWLRTDGKAQ